MAGAAPSSFGTSARIVPRRSRGMPRTSNKSAKSAAKRRVPPFLHPQDSVARQFLGVGGIEDREPDTVEAHQPIERGGPDVAGAVLDDGVDGVDWQTILHSPGLVHPRRFPNVGGCEDRGCCLRTGSDDIERRQRDQQCRYEGRRADIGTHDVEAKRHA